MAPTLVALSLQYLGSFSFWLTAVPPSLAATCGVSLGRGRVLPPPRDGRRKRVARREVDEGHDVVDGEQPVQPRPVLSRDGGDGRSSPALVRLRLGLESVAAIIFAAALVGSGRLFGGGCGRAALGDGRLGGAARVSGASVGDVIEYATSVAIVVDGVDVQVVIGLGRM